jgi:signal transduction histidine kinase
LLREGSAGGHQHSKKRGAWQHLRAILYLQTLRVILRAGPVLDVADVGPGVPPEKRARVLRRFYRLDRSRSTPDSGLGLALVAAKLHGTAPALSDAAPGLCVTVKLSGAAANLR